MSQLDKLIVKSSNDGKIDQKEYELISSRIDQLNNKEHASFEDDKGNIAFDKITAHIKQVCDQNKIAVDMQSISNPNNQSQNQQSFIFNVYIENSASIDGYVNGSTEFKDAIYDFLGDLKNSGVCDTLNLNYINNTIPYTKRNAQIPDIENFIEKLDPTSFKSHGGDRSESDIKDILNHVLQTVDDKSVAVLVSDFVFSPGKGKKADDYLTQQNIGIKHIFENKLRLFNLSLAILQLKSKFNGKYFDKTNKPIELNCERPYYLWIIGSDNQIKSIFEKKLLDKERIKGGYLNRLVFQPTKQIQPIEFKILYNPKIGSFNPANLNNGVIEDAKASKDVNHIFSINVAAHFLNNFQDSNFILSKSNYELNDKSYSINISSNNGVYGSIYDNYEYLINFQTNDLKEETLNLKLIGKVPSWVSSSSSEDDAYILTDNNEKNKTFGLKYLINGVNDAFYQNNPVLNQFSLTIKQ